LRRCSGPSPACGVRLWSTRFRGSSGPESCKLGGIGSTASELARFVGGRLSGQQKATEFRGTGQAKHGGLGCGLEPGRYFRPHGHRLMLQCVRLQSANGCDFLGWHCGCDCWILRVQPRG
jgi:hypothetical protein